MLIAKLKDNIVKKDLNVKKFNSIFKRKIHTLESLKTKKNFSKIEVDNFVIKIAEKKSELKKAQALRYSVFYKEKKAIPTISKKILRLDYDKVDKFADHLIVIDKNRKGIKNKIVGTYRLLRGDVAAHCGGFYTSSEFDLSKILNSYKNNQILELGRSCVHQDYRNGTIMHILWKAIAEYVKSYDIKILLGCASFHGTDVMKYTNELSYLRKNFSLPDELSVKSLDTKIYPVYTEINSKTNDLRTFVKLPPLIKGYLRIGGKVSHDCFVDHKFNTIDLCVIVTTDNIDEKYKKKYLN
jgi:putative hemolysin